MYVYIYRHTHTLSIPIAYRFMPRKKVIIRRYLICSGCGGTSAACSRDIPMAGALPRRRTVPRRCGCGGSKATNIGWMVIVHRQV